MLFCICKHTLIYPKYIGICVKLCAYEIKVCYLPMRLFLLWSKTFFVFCKQIGFRPSSTPLKSMDSLFCPWCNRIRLNVSVKELWTILLKFHWRFLIRGPLFKLYCLYCPMTFMQEISISCNISIPIFGSITYGFLKLNPRLYFSYLILN